MGKVDSVDEILEFAIAREVEANQLYTYMAACVEDPDIRQACEDFAREELEHKAKLQFEVMKRGQVVSELAIPDNVMTITEHLKMDYKELLLFAIEKEELSITLYTDLATMLEDRESYETLLALAKEEIKHKERFQVEYNNLIKQK